MKVLSLILCLALSACVPKPSPCCEEAERQKARADKAEVSLKELQDAVIADKPQPK